MNDAAATALRIVAAIALGVFGVLRLRQDLRKLKARRDAKESRTSRGQARRSEINEVGLMVWLRVWSAAAMIAAVLAVFAVFVFAPLWVFRLLYVLVGLAAVVYLVGSVVQGLMEAKKDAESHR